MAAQTFWFVVLAFPAPGQPGQGNLTAYVDGPLTPAQFSAKYNETAVASGPNQNQYPTRAAAQARASAYNKQPASQRQQSSASGAATAPAGTTQGVGFNVPSIPSGWQLVFGNTGGLLGRILKVAIGGILLIAGILKLSGTDKKLQQVLPLVGGPAGKVLSA